MQLNVNADVFESAVAWYAARTGPAAATTSAAVPSSTARERSHRPGDIPGPPPAGTGVWREVRLPAEEASGCSLAAGHSPGLIARPYCADRPCPAVSARSAPGPGRRGRPDPAGATRTRPGPG